MRGNPVQNLVQDAPLGGLQPGLGHFDDARRTLASRTAGVPVIAQSLIGNAAFEAARVAEPRQLPRVHLEEVCERA